MTMLARTVTVSTLLLTAMVGCSSLKGGRCDSCEQGMVYPPAGYYPSTTPAITEPGMTPAPAPIPLPPGADPAMPPAPPPPLGARIPATLQNIRYSTGEFFHNTNQNMRAMFTR